MTSYDAFSYFLIAVCLASAWTIAAILTPCLREVIADVQASERRPD